MTDLDRMSDEELAAEFRQAYKRHIDAAEVIKGREYKFSYRADRPENTSAFTGDWNPVGRRLEWRISRTVVLEPIVTEI